MEFLDKAYSPKKVESKWYSFWEENRLFTSQENSGKAFTIILPPPNVTGVLHMGHAFGNTLQDIVIRKKRMEGKKVLWIPGTDHAGIATQTVVERALYQETGKRRTDFSRKEFVEKVWEFKDKHETTIQNQLKKLGCSLAWDHYRFTMDEKSSKAVKTAFKELYEQNLLYRGDYLVHWDPITQTALSDDEVEYEEKEGFLWYIRYPIEGRNEYLVIATTRPETLLGDVAIAVHPEDPRFPSLIGQKVIVPFVDRKIPILADPFVEPQFGTGAVKITPAHDFNDYEMGLRHNLERINVLTPEAKINEKGTSLFAGLTVEKAREKIVEELKKRDLLEKVEPHKLRLGYSYRSKGVIQPYLSKQWFIKMKPFKEKLLAIVREKKVKLIPSQWEETYFHWIENLRDWCISRQLWWGHQIPIWYAKKDPEKMICHIEEGLPQEVAKNPEEWKQDEDVLDTWFSSALWPFSTLGWPEKTKDLQTFYPTSLLVTGHDILFFWVARMILMGEIFLKEVPFTEAFIHGLIYGKSYFRRTDKGVEYVSKQEKAFYEEGETLPKEVEAKWEKMSKSKGNVIDPLEIVEQYGTDALRMTLSFSATHARQIDLDKRRFEEFKNFVNKVWNGARFVLMNCSEQKEPLTLEEVQEGLDPSLFTLEDRWILAELQEVISQVNSSLDQYAFDKATSLAYSFYWDRFCSLYLELVKPVIFGKAKGKKEKKNKQKILLFVLEKMLRLMHPIIPYITEELFSYLQKLYPSKGLKAKEEYAKDFLQSLSSRACMVAPYPKALPSKDKSSQENFSLMEKLLYTARNLRGEMALSPGEKTALYVVGEKSSLFCLAEENKEMFEALLPLDMLHFTSKEQEGFGAFAMVQGVKLFIPLPESLKIREKTRLLKEKEKILKTVELSEQKLSSPEFLQKAPEKIVKNFKKQLEEAKLSLDKLEKKLNSL